jgi:hypothetical protein
MPAKLLHPVDEIIAQIMWANRSLGADPSPWETYFEGKGNVPTTTWPIFAGVLPSEPDNLICVFETAPQQDARIMVTGENQQHYGFTVQVNGKNRRAAFQKTRDIEHDFTRLFLDQQVTIDGQQYLVPSIPHCIVIPMPKDSISPGVWSLNLNCLANVLAYPIQG